MSYIYTVQMNIPAELEARVQKATRELDAARAAASGDDPRAAGALDAAIEEALNARAALSEWTT